MKRREFLALAGAAGAAAWLPRVAVGQQAGKVTRIVVLSNSLPDSSRRDLLQGLADYGYVEGRNVSVEYLTAPTVRDVPDYAARAVALKPDLIITLQSPAPVALKELNTTIPVVMAGLQDPVAIGAVSSYMRPGGNITGMMTGSPDAISKTLELVRLVMPNLSRLGLMGLPDDPVYRIYIERIEPAIKALNITSIGMSTKEGDDFDALFARAKGAGAQAVFVFAGNYLQTLPVAARLTELAIKHNLPIFSPATVAARDGGMILGYQGDGFAMNPDINARRRAGYYVDLILKGAKPGDLPIEGPTNFTLVVNLKTAKAMGISIPESVLFQATEIVQ
jgi:putative ABC transport system substrate-binding protein